MHNVPSYDVENINTTNWGEYLLIRCGLFLEEQKRCRKETRETGEQLYFDPRILKEGKMRRKNVAMVWVDYKKAFDIVLQKGIINFLKLYKILDEVIQFIEKTMKNWSVELTAGETMISCGDNPERVLPVWFAISTSICDSDDAT